MRYHAVEPTVGFVKGSRLVVTVLYSEYDLYVLVYCEMLDATPPWTPTPTWFRPHVFMLTPRYVN
jgi:hypothetical protein